MAFQADAFQDDAFQLDGEVPAAASFRWRTLGIRIALSALFLWG